MELSEALLDPNTDQTDGPLQKAKPVLFKPRSTRKKSLAGQASDGRGKVGVLQKKDSWDDMMMELSAFSRSKLHQPKKKRWLSRNKTESNLEESLSFSADDLQKIDLQKKQKKEEDTSTRRQPKTFIYKFPGRDRKANRGIGRLSVQGKEEPDVPPARPPPPKPPRPMRGKSMERNKPTTFTELDISAPTKERSSSIIKFTNDLGILRLKLLAVSDPTFSSKTIHEEDTSDEDESSTTPVELEPTDGLFCIFSVNNNQAKAESSVQPLVPKKRAAIWDNSESSVFFYANPSQQLFVTCRRIPLSDVGEQGYDDEPLSLRPSAETIGVGIKNIKALDHACVDDDCLIENWVETDVEWKQVRVELEPTGSVLLGLSYYCELNVFGGFYHNVLI